MESGNVHLDQEIIYPTREHPNLESPVRAFLKTLPAKPQAACFGIAGPVRNGRATMSNRGWVVDAAALAREIGVEQVSLINDLVANAYGIAALEEKDFAVINAGSPDPYGNAAVISAGTGLGEAGMYFDGEMLRPFACEGGHVDFAPADDLQTEMLKRLRAESNHVSWERVLSGHGIFNIYRFLRDTGRGEESASIREEIQKGNPAAVVTKAALEKKCALCQMTLDMFVSLYGAEAGNVALKLMATAGLYIGGGIAPRIVTKLQEPTFMSAFTNKGRMNTLLSTIPVKVILNDNTALLGAARAAALSAGLL